MTKTVTGFMWNKEKDGKPYMLGFFTFTDQFGKDERVELAVFPNELKEEKSDPDWKVFPKKI